MRVATFNMEHGAAAAGSERHGEIPDATSLFDLAREIRALEIDVLCLQEVDQGQRRSGGLNQAEILSRELAMPHYRFAAFFQGWVNGFRFQPLRSDAGGRMAFGIATLSRLPVASWHVNPMGGRVPRLNWRRDRSGWRPSERLAVVDTTRTLLAAQVTAPEGRVVVANTHLVADEGVARAQLHEVVRSLGTLPAPRVLAADLNLEITHEGAVPGMRQLVIGDTFTNARPRRQIDHVLATPDVRVRASGVESLGFSDHRLAWADVALE